MERPERKNGRHGSASYNWNAHRNRPVEIQSRLFMLPAELRVMIFRYILHCSYLIHPGRAGSNPDLLHIDERDKANININVLQTCRQMNEEGSAIFFGENTFDLLHPIVQPNITGMLAPRNIVWLKELKIEVPFLKGTVDVHKSALNDVNPFPPEQRIIGAGLCRPDFMLNTLLQCDLDAICNASRLQKLVLVADSSWPVVAKVSRWELWSPHCTLELVRGYLHLPGAWRDFAALIERRPDLETTVVRLYESSRPFHNKKEFDRLRKNLAARFGIWDFREALKVFDDRTKLKTWEMPPMNLAEDPSDILESIHTMFNPEGWIENVKSQQKA